MRNDLYAVYDPENGLEEFATREEAFEYAQKVIEEYRDLASANGEWHDEEVLGVRVFSLLGEVVEIPCHSVPEDYPDTGDYVNFELREV